MLTAIEKRLPGGRFTANLLFGLLVFWLLIVLLGRIVDGLLIPLIDFLSFQHAPRLASNEAVAAVLALLGLVVGILANATWIGRFRRRVGSLGNRVGFLNAITTLIELKEAGTALLNEDLPRADQAALTNWLARNRLWEDGVVTALHAAGAPQAAISDFTTLIIFEPVGPAVSEEHARQKGMLAARLQRLRVIINDLDRDQRAESQLEKLRRIWPKS